MDEKITQYMTLDTEVSETEARLERLKAERSALVKSIHDAHGKGPYTMAGRTLFIFSRGETWFFSLPRGKGKG